MASYFTKKALCEPPTHKPITGALEQSIFCFVLCMCVAYVTLVQNKLTVEYINDSSVAKCFIVVCSAFSDLSFRASSWSLGRPIS